MVSDEELTAIVNVMRKTPKPVLIHCRSGADRAGLVAALYQYVIARKTAEEASNQLSILYGHFPFLGNSTVMMDRSFWRYVNVMP
jgi:protein tyrosine/serine phosphatase